MKPDWNCRFAAGLLAILLCLCSFSMDDRRTDSKVHGHGQKNGQYSQV